MSIGFSHFRIHSFHVRSSHQNENGCEGITKSKEIKSNHHSPRSLLVVGAYSLENRCDFGLDSPSDSKHP
jgi:hypothetical protein